MSEQKQEASIDERIAYIGLVQHMRSTQRGTAKTVNDLSPSDLAQWMLAALGPDDAELPMVEFIERERLDIENFGSYWIVTHGETGATGEGPTVAMAIQRCYVGLAFGENLDGSPGA